MSLRDSYDRSTGPRLFCSPGLFTEKLVFAWIELIVTITMRHISGV